MKSMILTGILSGRNENEINGVGGESGD